MHGQAILLSAPASNSRKGPENKGDLPLKDGLLLAPHPYSR